MTVSLVLGTRNAGKLRELRRLFAAAGCLAIDLAEAGWAEEQPGEDAVEPFESFEANALSKARFYQRLTGRPCAADDSGLEVLALGGQPGVRSRRWASDCGEGAGDMANNARLMREMAGVEDRRARFVCAAAYVDGARSFVRFGACDGTITDQPYGVGGFGYDPYFHCGELGRTLAEASVDEKARVSHRGRAFAALIAAIGCGD